MASSSIWNIWAGLLGPCECLYHLSITYSIIVGILAWEKSQIYSYLKTHYDIASILTMRMLGCQNPISDYTIGRLLFLKRSHTFLVAASYSVIMLLL